jgi:hypothetical protein
LGEYLFGLGTASVLRTQVDRDIVAADDGFKDTFWENTFLDWEQRFHAFSNPTLPTTHGNSLRTHAPALGYLGYLIVSRRPTATGEVRTTLYERSVVHVSSSSSASSSAWVSRIAKEL